MESVLSYEKLLSEVTEELTLHHSEDYTAALDATPPHYQKAWEHCRQAIRHYVTHMQRIPKSLNNEETIQNLFYDAILWGPVSPLILTGAGEGISDIKIYGPNDICVKQTGHWKRLPIAFRSEHDLELMVHKLLAYSDTNISDLNGFTDRTKLPTGARVTLFQAPNTGAAYLIFIRLYKDEMFSSENLVASGSISLKQDALLKFLMRSKGNSGWFGPMGAGKTTALAAYLPHLPLQWHILTIEDSPEFLLHLRNPKAIVSELYVHNLDFALTWKEASRMALRTAANVIIWGEVRDALSAYRAIDNMLTGHRGSALTGHAGTPEEGIQNLVSRYQEAFPNLDTVIVEQRVTNALNFTPMLQFDRTGRQYMGDICAVTWDPKKKEPLIVPILKRRFDRHNIAQEEYLGIPDFLKQKLISTNAVFEEDFLPWETCS